MPGTLVPGSFDAAAAALADAASDGRTVHLAGGGTRAGWVADGPAPDLIVSTRGLVGLLEHNAGDLTATVAAGTRVGELQAELAESGQRLAIDAPLGTATGEPVATVGGLIATGDAGPLAHRYGAPRDQILGITVALSDGTVARAGGRVIKNVAGYDLAKLFCGSFGTLGMILSVTLRLRTLPAASATALGASADADAIAQAAVRLAGAPLELEAFDVAWREGRGGLLAQVAGAEAARRAELVAALMRDAGLQHVEVTGDDAPLWARQRAGQRSGRAAIVRVAAPPSALGQMLRLSDELGGTLVGRAGLGLSYLEVDPAAVAGLRARLPTGAHAVVLDRPAGTALDVWGPGDDVSRTLMRAVKARFDPAAVCDPGVFVGGI